MEQELNYEALYNTAQQELANAQHTIRVLVAKLNELQEEESNEPETTPKGKKVN